jgi:hypothetical protein
VHEVSPYSALPFDKSRATKAVFECLNNGIVLLKNDTGIIGGRVFETPFSDAMVAAEQIWWSFSKHKRRDELELLEAFEYWARNIVRAQAIEIGSFKPSNYFTNKGYGQVETGYMAIL